MYRAWNSSGVGGLQLHKILLNVTNNCRLISTELTSALRPFYFMVHPDFFEKHPTQRRVNENSLKQLNSCLESFGKQQQHHYTNKATSGGKDSKQILQFYIRDKNATRQETFKLIKVNLDQQTTDPKLLIQNLLELCNLPTDYIKNIKTKETPRKTTNYDNINVEHQQPFTNQYKYGFDYSEERQYQQEPKFIKTLDSWLEVNVPLAKSRAKELAELREEVEKLRKTVVKRLQLLDARYDCGWNYEHYRGCLKTLERLANLHENQMEILKNRIVVFGTFTGVSLEGHIMLYTGDVLNNWIDFIKNIPHQDKFLKKIPLYENTLSQVLLNINIGRRKFMPKQQAMEYAAHLLKVTTTLGDYLTVNKFPKTWPAMLNDYEIVIESEAGPLMVNPTGQFIAPSTCPGFILVDFITTNLDLAKERIVKYKTLKNIEKDLTERCIKHMKLDTLTKEDSVTTEKMIEALEKLLIYEPEQFYNTNLHITNYYSVLSDGIICIPWDFITNVGKRT